MRRYLRVLLGCILFSFCSILYVFSQLAASLEPYDGWMGRKPQQRTAFPWGESGHGVGKGAGKAGLEDQHWSNRCKNFSVSFWNPYWRLPSGVCGKNCFWEAAFRYIMRKADASDPSNTPVETMHLAVVACGERLEETVTMLKSVVLFNIKPIQFHIFAEDNLHIKFKDILDSWLESYRLKFNYTVHSITFPSGNAAEWKKLFKPCASQRLFLPIILKDVDSLLYVDTDILFLQPVDEIWSFFREFNSTQIAAMAPEHEEPSIGWYNRFARHPFYGKTGINSGVMLMNMTRIRKKYFKNDMTTAQLQWEEMLMSLLKKYKLNITWGDQDLLNIIFHYNPESLFVFPCHWNYRPDHCIYGSNCKSAEEGGIFILHGNRGVYHDHKQPAFKAIYQAIQQYTFGDDPVHSLLYPLQQELRKTTHTYCGKVHHLFTKQLQKSLGMIQDRVSRGR
ncbi:glucoside xylosyltransferase 1-like isoform X1 [Polyodon spathula]|uniref:glucoside xylosyltransferase 1-like isoform X1 n=1 Tax=Polyodon spathula TaxID=7913 RepID=UPI001B7E7394|nr:glucoside xylosyltransferase 1-like isoform X1 [Polyodon spathula]